MALGAITYKSAFPCLKTKFRIIKVGIPKFGSNTFSFTLINNIGCIITTLYLEKSFKLS